MAKWRFGRNWSTAELDESLAELEAKDRNFPEAAQKDMRPEAGWRRELREWVIDREPPGPPADRGPFARAKAALRRFDFSDPAIVSARFDRRAPLLGRRMLLELKVLGLRYLCGVMVSAVRSADEEGASAFGYRYDTLDGHLERGNEWFVLRKDHASGEIRFRVSTVWRPGDFPNWWSRAGFPIFSSYYRALWLNRAAERLRVLAREPAELLPAPAPAPTARTLVTAAMLGVVTGVRSIAAPVLLARRCASRGPRRGAGRLDRVCSSPTAAVWLTAAAAGEMLADKHPRIPARVGAPALAGRVASGALAGASLAGRRRKSAWAPALAGALAAGLAAVGSYQLRIRLHRRFGVSSSLLGLCEDAAVLAASARLGRRLDREEESL